MRPDQPEAGEPAVPRPGVSGSPTAEGDHAVDRGDRGDYAVDRGDRGDYAVDQGDRGGYAVDQGDRSDYAVDQGDRSDYAVNRGDRGGRGAATASGEQPRAAPASRAEQLAEHARLRESVNASDQAAADRAAWTGAVDGLRAEWAQHKERYPDHAQAAPRTEPDGSWVSGEHRRLDPEQNTEATKAHADLADEAQRYILPAVRRIEAADPERRLAGLEHMVKGEDRLKEKLSDYLRAPGVTVREAVDEIPDAVRATFCYSAEGYSRGVLGDVDRFKGEGFELIKLKNLWDADQYKGINSQWRVSETGSRFEMQFHTPESLAAKELTHEAYERIRATTVDPAEQRDLEDFQRRVNALVAIPRGTGQIKDFPEKNDG